MLPTIKEKILREEIVKESEREYTVNFWYTLDGEDIIKKSRMTMSQADASRHLERYRKKFEEAVKGELSSPEMMDVLDDRLMNKSEIDEEITLLKEEFQLYKADIAKTASMNDVLQLERKIEKLLKQVTKHGRKVNILWFFLVTLPLIVASCLLVIMLIPQIMNIL